jgi:hypothetical protein
MRYTFSRKIIFTMQFMSVQGTKKTKLRVHHG